MDERVLRIAKSVRKSAENFYGDPDLEGVCCEVSKVLCRVFKSNGFDATFVVGRFLGMKIDDGPDHCWVELWGQIIDLTATQFTPKEQGTKEKVFLPVDQEVLLYKVHEKGRNAIIYVNEVWTADPEERLRKLQWVVERDLNKLQQEAA